MGIFICNIDICWVDLIYGHQMLPASLGCVFNHSVENQIYYTLLRPVNKMCFSKKAWHFSALFFHQMHNWNIKPWTNPQPPPPVRLICRERCCGSGTGINSGRVMLGKAVMRITLAEMIWILIYAVMVPVAFLPPTHIGKIRLWNSRC